MQTNSVRLPPHCFLFFQVLVNGITTIEAIIQARNLGIIPNPPSLTKGFRRIQGGPRTVARSFSNPRPSMHNVFTVYMSFHDDFIMFLNFKVLFKNVKMMSLCSSTLKGKPNISRFQHNLLYFF